MDRLSDDQNAQDSFKGLLGTIEELPTHPHPLITKRDQSLPTFLRTVPKSFSF
jgi:hypothetical protein